MLFGCVCLTVPVSVCFCFVSNQTTYTYTYLVWDTSRNAVVIDSVREQHERDSKLISELGLTVGFMFVPTQLYCITVMKDQIVHVLKCALLFDTAALTRTSTQTMSLMRVRCATLST